MVPGSGERSRGASVLPLAVTFVIPADIAGGGTVQEKAEVVQSI